MVYRLYDWRCARCESVREDLTWVFNGGTPEHRCAILCDNCQAETMHDLILTPKTAKYLHDRAASPLVYGGSFDTMGHERAPALPEVPDGLAASGVVDFLQSKRFQETKRERIEVHKRNAKKRERAKALMAGGNVDFRRDRAPGDPKM